MSLLQPAALRFPLALNAPLIPQVSISEADLQAMGGTITMVTQEGTTITIPAHELATQGAHSVTMVTADGTDEQVSGPPENEPVVREKWPLVIDVRTFASLRWPSWLLTWPRSKPWRRRRCTTRTRVIRSRCLPPQTVLTSQFRWVG